MQKPRFATESGASVFVSPGPPAVSQDTTGFPPALILVVLVRKSKQVARYHHQNQDSDNSTGQNHHGEKSRRVRQSPGKAVVQIPQFQQGRVLTEGFGKELFLEESDKVNRKERGPGSGETEPKMHAPSTSPFSAILHSLNF